MTAVKVQKILKGLLIALLICGVFFIIDFYKKQERSYKMCENCSARLKEEDFDSKKAFVVGDLYFCDLCAYRKFEKCSVCKGFVADNFFNGYCSEKCMDIDTVRCGLCDERYPKRECVRATFDGENGWVCVDCISKNGPLKFKSPPSFNERWGALKEALK